MILAASVAFILEPLLPLGDWRWAIVAAIGLLVYVLSDHQMRRRIWQSTGRTLKNGPSLAKSRVPTTVDPKQSEVTCLGGASLLVSVFVSTENQHPVDVRIKSAELRVLMKDGSRLDTRPVEFQHEVIDSDPYTCTIGAVVVPAKDVLSGWFHFSCEEDIRVAEFASFELRVQAVGEPPEDYRFEPYDWDYVRRGQSTIVMQPLARIMHQGPDPGRDTRASVW